MVLMSGGFVINDVVWEFHETTLDRNNKILELYYKVCYSIGIRKATAHKVVDLRYRL